MIISRWILLRTKNVSDRKSHTFYIQYLFSRLWDNVEKYGTADRAPMKIRHMRFACRITQATDTQPEYVILIAFRQQQDSSNAPQNYVYIYIANLVVSSKFTNMLNFTYTSSGIQWRRHHVCNHFIQTNKQRFIQNFWMCVLRTSTQNFTPLSKLLYYISSSKNDRKIINKWALII